MLGSSSYFYSPHPHPHWSDPRPPFILIIHWLTILSPIQQDPSHQPTLTDSYMLYLPNLILHNIIILIPHHYIICLTDHLTLVTPFVNNDLNLNFWKIIMLLLYWMVYKGSNYIPTAYFPECHGVLDSFDEPRSRWCAVMLSCTHQLATWRMTMMTWSILFSHDPDEKILTPGDIITARLSSLPNIPGTDYWYLKGVGSVQ